MSDLRKLRTTLQGLRETRVHKVSGGNVSDFAVYKQITGEIRGIGIAIQEIEDQLTKHQTDEEF